MGLLYGAFLLIASGWNPDLGEASPRPPVEGRGAAPQTPLHKGQFVGSEARLALVRSVVLQIAPSRETKS